MKNFLINVLFVTAAAIMLLFLPACAENDIGDTDSETENAMAESLFDLDLTEREIAFVEDLTEKEFETLTLDDLKTYKTISVVGNHVLFGEYLFTGGPEYYMIEYDSYDVGPDYSDCIYLLQYFPEINNISIYFNYNLRDVDFLKNIPNLKKLTLYGTRVEDLTVLKHHPNLKTLSVTNVPISALEFHPDAKLDSIYLWNTFFGDLSVIEEQHQMETLKILDSFVPITNTQVLERFSSLDTLALVAPECDYSFFENMYCSIDAVTLGGYDNIDLSVLENVIGYIRTFRLDFSNGTDLTILDKLPDNCDITLLSSIPGVRGERTAEGSANFRESGTGELIRHYYEANLPEFLPDEFK